MQTINGQHPNKRNYFVDAEITLMISEVKLDDVGEYKCISRINSTFTRTKSYYLAVSGLPKCNGTTSVVESHVVSFSCQSPFSGNHKPNLEWRRESEYVDGDVVTSRDMYDVRLAKIIHTREVSAGDDDTHMTCVMTFGNIRANCSVPLTVFYMVRDLVMDPIKETYEVGEEIRCSANGNPTPQIYFEPARVQGRDGVGWRSSLIPKSAAGQRSSIECIATNTVNNKTESIRKILPLLIGLLVLDETSTDDELESETPNPAKSTSASSSGAIVGGIVVGIMILIIVVAVVFCVRLRKERKLKKAENGGAKPPDVTTNRDKEQKKDKEIQA